MHISDSDEEPAQKDRAFAARFLGLFGYFPMPDPAETLDAPTKRESQGRVAAVPPTSQKERSFNFRE